MYKHLVKTLAVLVVLVVCGTHMVIEADAAYLQFENQEQAHERANQLRDEGAAEDDPRIKAEKDIWWLAQNQFWYERDLVATAIYIEAWGGCSDRHRELVGSVIYNRLNSDVWPDSIYEILAAPRQYSKSYVTPGSRAWDSARADQEIWAHCRSIAEKVLRGEVECPPNVVYQSNEKQGKVYEKYYTPYSVTYFCYGKS